MNKRLFILILVFAFAFACDDSGLNRAKKILVSNKEILTSKKLYDPSAMLITCDSLHFGVLPQSGKQKLILFNGLRTIDTLIFGAQNFSPGFENEIIKADLNYDGYCDIVIPDKYSVKNEGVLHYYYMFDPDLKKFNQNLSLPAYIGGLKLDIKNQRLKLYCPGQDCFAYYKYTIDKKFVMVQGEFKSVY
jgi:hypothetical protein